MWASFEMLDTFYGYMALLYHFVGDSLQLHNPYFISSQMKMTIVPKFCYFYRYLFYFQRIVCLFLQFLQKYYIQRLFFNNQRVMIFHKNDTQLSLFWKWRVYLTTVPLTQILWNAVFENLVQNSHMFEFWQLWGTTSCLINGSIDKIGTFLSF
jgi:hypothetical protein